MVARRAAHWSHGHPFDRPLGGRSATAGTFACARSVLGRACSFRLRARRTCELAGPIAGTEPDLAEDYGDYEGLRFAEIVKDRPGWDIFIDGCPNGETPVQVAARADRLIARLEALDVALFSHGHFSRVLAMRWIVMSEHFALTTGSLSILDSRACGLLSPILVGLICLPHC